MEVFFTKAANKQLDNLEKELAKRITTKIRLLSLDPFTLDSEKLQENLGYRIRVGNHRVVYKIDKKTKTIFIVKIAHRREVYRR